MSAECLEGYFLSCFSYLSISETKKNKVIYTGIGAITCDEANTQVMMSELSIAPG